MAAPTPSTAAAGAAAPAVHNNNPTAQQPHRRKHSWMPHAAELTFGARQATIMSLFLRTQEEIDVALFSDAPATPKGGNICRRGAVFCPTEPISLC